MLSNITQSVKQSIEQIGIINTTRNLGFDVNSYDNMKLAGELLMSNVIQNAPSTISKYVTVMRNRLNTKTLEFLIKHQEQLQHVLDQTKQRNYQYDYFSASTEIKTYLPKFIYDENMDDSTLNVCETPQLQSLRIAIQLYADVGINEVIKAYNEMSSHYYTHATPTIFNAGLKKSTMISCYLLDIQDDLGSIASGFSDASLISKANGGLGIDISRLRHSEIDNKGMSQGLIPMIQVINSIVRYVDQGGMRKGACTVSLDVHHIDLMDFVSVVEKIGEQYTRAHDINISVWIPSLFFKRVESKGNWTLFCPAHAKELLDTFGEEFEDKYVALEALAQERENRYHFAKASFNGNKEELLKHINPSEQLIAKFHSARERYQQAKRNRIAHKVLTANEVLEHIVKVQGTTGMPYIMHRDACNIKSNQKHQGRVYTNLCQEILEHADKDEIASCNLVSINLRKFAHRQKDDNTAQYDYKQLGEMTRSAVTNLNRVIDTNWYPLDERDSQGNVTKQGKISLTNFAHRPIGIGVSGLAEALFKLDLSFEDTETIQVNKNIFACMYFNAMAQSVQLAIKDGVYSSFKGSPLSQGKLQFDLWADEFNIVRENKFRKAEDDKPVDPSLFNQQSVPLYDNDNKHIDTILPTWDDLRRCVMNYGARNSLLIALMPTATTAQKLRNTETTEAPMSNVYTRKVMNGAFIVLNRYLEKDMKAINLWTPEVVNGLMASEGSVQTIDQYITTTLTSQQHSRLNHIKHKYKTIWEIPQKLFLQMAADRGRYVCQSQSLNVYIANADARKLKALHMTSSMLGLKTGLYYLRSQPVGQGIKFNLNTNNNSNEKECLVCSS
jgi:ribonucleoside-diphosphate reductase alpha chain